MNATIATFGFITAVAITATSPAGVVNVDFNYGDCTIHNMDDGVLSPVGGRFWNGVTASDGNVRFLLDAFGTPTGIGCETRVTTGLTQFCNLQGYNFLQDTGVGSSSSETQAKLRIIGLDRDARYDLAVYMGNLFNTGGFRPPTIQVRHGDGSTRDTQLSPATNALPGLRRLDYLLFEQLRPTSLGGGAYGLKVDIITASGGDAAIVTGFQISSGSCEADVNGDGRVDTLDYVAVLVAWGRSGGPEDINGDGVVDADDLLLVLTGWGPCA